MGNPGPPARTAHLARLRRTPLLALVLAAALAAIACGSDGGDGTGPDPAINPLDTVAPLRDLAAQRGIGIGTAVGVGFGAPGQEGERFREILAEQFNVVTPENAMKFDHAHPAPGTYSFAAADALLDFAESNGAEVRGHTLIWHQQLPSWVTAGSWTVAEAEELLREHTSTVVGHYAGRVVAWDVVNEALEQDGSLRAGFWADHIGRDYIALAFETAHAADPAAELFYNDYGIAWLNEKSDSVYSMLADLVHRGVPVHGIGFQGHFEVGNLPSSAALRSNFQRFGDLGLKVHVTELDVRIPLPASASELQQQGQDYRRVMEACLDVPACEMVVTWGFTDRYSWVPGTFPGFGAALLLTEEYQPKHAYWGVHGPLSDG